MKEKRVTHEANGLKAVFREKLGSDVLDASVVHHILAEHIGKQLKVKDSSKIPNRFWARILFVTNVIQQTVSLEGEDRFEIPNIDSPAEDITDFYEFVMALSADLIDFFREGLRKFDAVPLVTGAPDDSNSASAPVQDSLVPTN